MKKTGKNYNSLNAKNLMDNNLANIGIQLYTVRDLMKKNVPLTLQRIADIGYKEISPECVLKCDFKLSSLEKAFGH